MSDDYQFDHEQDWRGSHRLEVVSDFLVKGWLAACSCGWESEPYATNQAALEAADRHREASQ